eukprot:5385719-Prorocentrum_lima.AAC.1
MTSSLVGSEMCIRDSAAGIAMQTDCTGRISIETAFRMMGVSLEHAVSYTHLTLPTICSV